jgi:hypothetical protein
MTYYSTSPSRRLFLLLAATALIPALIAPAPAQRGKSRNPAAAAKARDNESYQREMRLRSLTTDSKKRDDKQQRLLLTQIKEDFEQIQQINNETMRTISNSETLDYKLISSTFGEINKRAKRLKTNLSIPEAEEKPVIKTAASNGDQLKESLLELDDLIMSFVTNPLFQNPSVIDVELSARAGRDLEGIIYMSQNVKKTAEKLDKASPLR